jgi:hypothetical protein
LYPFTLGELSAFHDRLTVWIGAAMPVPARAATDGELVALLTNEILVEAAPLDCGVNVTVKFTLWPADKANGNDSPLIENSELSISTDDTTMLAPVALKIPVWDPLVPTVTLPALIVEGLTLSCPEEAPAADVPVPDIAMLRGLLDPPLLSITVPVAPPMASGENTIEKVALCPAGKVKGRFKPLVLNAAVETLAAVIVRLVPPVLVTVSESV